MSVWAEANKRLGSEKLGICLACDFFHKVRQEESGSFIVLKEEQMAKLFQ